MVNPAKVIYVLSTYSPSMVSIKHLVCILLIIAILVSGLFIFQNTRAQTIAGGTLTCSTEWTVSQSPITLNSSLTVNNNVTLTIEPGVTVNLGTGGILVFGTLIAQGNVNNPIVFNAGGGNQTLTTIATSPIYLAPPQGNAASNNTESIIQYAVLNSVTVYLGASTAEVDSCTFNYAAPYSAPISIQSGLCIVSNNIINYNVNQFYNYGVNFVNVNGGSPQIINNQFEGSFSNSPNAGVAVSTGSPLISGNTFAAQYINNSDGVKVSGGSPQIISNQFQGNGWLIGVDDSSTSSFTVSNNVFSSCYIGVNAKTESLLTVQGNQLLKGNDGVDISGTAQVTITGNLIDGNSRYGINGGGGAISSNTIVNNQIGIHNPLSGTISDNNIVCNTQNSITATISSIDAKNNWWGIADAATINQTIYDTKVDPHLGTILFAPFLIQPSSSAPPIPSDTPAVTPVPAQPVKQAPTTTPQPITTPTPTPDQYSQTFAYQVGNLINLNLIAIVVAAVLVVVWVTVILGYTAKRIISKNKAKK